MVQMLQMEGRTKGGKGEAHSDLVVTIMPSCLPVGVTDLLDDAVQLLRSLALPLPLQLVSVRPQIQLINLQ